MRNKFNMGSVVICAMAIMFEFAAQARTFEFKQLKSTGTTGSAEYWWEGTEKSKSSWFQVKIGGATKIDDMSEMEIRAATVLKSVKDKKTGINDIATFEFDPINKCKAIFFMISTGSAFSRERESYYYGNVNTGWQLAGIIIEIWQKGKVVKHWSNMSGKDGKVKLTENIKKLRINRDGHPSEGERYYSAKDFDNATEIYSVDQKGERIDIDEVLKPFRESEEGNKASSKGDDASVAQPSAKNTVAPKLRTCEFLLNKKFKKNAKFYLCLFSASWCPPCRAEMPRIAKTYAETLRDDPDIELIHFSRDQDEEKAMAWAKEHDVKFPVVRPRGGNPLDLHTRGIPHLFIVKADGTLVEEGHPMDIFNEEKFREIKGGGSISTPAPQTCKVNVTGDEGSQSTGRNVAAQKLQDCEFLLNKDFKKNAKFYLCLFSASWCPPCRREMPRIAKTYAETLKDDPDIELIHFSCDQNDEKALAWAKEHAVKFPVVKPKGGNPLDLHSRGIPHLFIVKADGTLVEEGHPMRLFTEEKLSDLVGKKTISVKPATDDEGRRIGGGREEVNGYMWSYKVEDDSAEIVATTDGKNHLCAVSPRPKGHVTIPSKLGGLPVKRIGRSALQGCTEMTSVTIPAGVLIIDYQSFKGCEALTKVDIPEGVTYIGLEAFGNCQLLKSLNIPSSVNNIEILAFYNCRGLGEGIVIRDGWVLTANGRCPTEYEIPEGTKGIAAHGFRGCPGLRSVKVPASVKHMCYWAFAYCDDLKTITMCGECPEKRINVFSPNQHIESVHVPANCKSWEGMSTWQGIPLVFDAEVK